MTSSLVGSEMCIRDSIEGLNSLPPEKLKGEFLVPLETSSLTSSAHPSSCLLYTSDAADDM
eukprot:12241579-Prorocentrum_lima.AAC.1